MIVCGGHSAEFASLLKENGAEEVVFPKGKDIIPELEKNGMSFLLEKGILASKATDTDGVEHVLFCLGAGSLIHKYSYASQNSALFAEIMPLGKDAKCLVISTEKLYELKCQNPDLCKAIDADAESVQNYLIMASVAFHSGEGLGRVAAFLYCFHDARMLVDFSQRRIATFTNLSLSQVWRSISELRKEDAIQTGMGGIIILDLKKLKQFVPDSVTYCNLSKCNTKK